MAGAWRWRIRKRLWDWIYGQLFRAIRVPPLPAPNDAQVVVQSWRQVHHQALDNVFTAAETPADELSRAKRFVRKMVVKIRWLVPQLQPNAPAVSASPEALMQQVWSASHARAYDGKPCVPPCYQDPPELGRLLSDGPFFGFVSSQQGALQIDLSIFSDLEHRPETRNLATCTTLELVDGELRATAIEHQLEGKRWTPADPGWSEAMRLVCAGMLTHVLIVQHLSWSHLSTASSFAMATRNALPKAHPIKALLWPHVHGTLDVNNTLAPALMDARPGEGVFGDVFNLTHAGAMALVRRAVDQFNVEQLAPLVDRQRRGLAEHPLQCVTEQDAIALWGLLSAHVSRWVELTYADDAALAKDAALLAFLSALDSYLPGGLRALVADLAAPSRVELIAVCSRQLYTATVIHEAAGNLTWNYITWPCWIPCRIYTDDRLPPADVYQRFFNVLFATNVPNRSILEDWAHVAPNADYRALLVTFKQSLLARQEQMKAEPFSFARLYPADLEAAIAV